MGDRKMILGVDEPQTPYRTMQSGLAPFDGQADTYDQRVGLREAECREITQSVLSIAEVRPGDVVVEVGAGTGQVGRWLVQAGLRYVGFDLSQGMLGVFRRRMDPASNTWMLLQADGNRPWPLADATARVIFTSRAIHLLSLGHVAQEVFRIGKSDCAALIIGRVQRERDSIKASMKQALLRQLRRHGVQGHEGEQNQRRLLEACCEQGAQVLDPLVVSRWTVASTPWQSIDSWKTKPGLGGVDLPASIKQEILKELELWAEATFNGLHQPVESEEAYVLQGVRLHPLP
jgi:ubiquinone/menaquinone biosynthesis C-methylase UbiE